MAPMCWLTWRSTWSPSRTPPPYPTVELDEIARAGPDLVIVPSEPYDFGPAHLAELAAALPAAQLVEVDGQDLFWWGSRTAAAVSRLAKALALRPMP